MKSYVVHVPDELAPYWWKRVDREHALRSTPTKWVQAPWSDDFKDMIEARPFARLGLVTWWVDGVGERRISGVVPALRKASIAPYVLEAYQALPTQRLSSAFAEPLTRAGMPRELENAQALEAFAASVLELGGDPFELINPAWTEELAIFSNVSNVAPEQRTQFRRAQFAAFAGLLPDDASSSKGTTMATTIIDPKRLDSRLVDAARRPSEVSNASALRQLHFDPSSSSPVVAIVGAVLGAAVGYYAGGRSPAGAAAGAAIGGLGGFAATSIHSVETAPA